MPLAPAALLAKLYTESVVIADALGTVHSVGVESQRWSFAGTDHAMIRVSIHVTGAVPDLMQGDRHDHEGGTVSVQQVDRVDGWPVTTTTYFRPVSA